MQLDPRSRLGPYEIVSLTGSGGMGEVYRARDLRLDRTVALKTLPGLTADQDRLSRFEREARLASSLNHPKAGHAKVLPILAGGSHLPFPGGRFDAVVVARLLYLTPDWRAILAEAHRVLAVGGCLLHEWGNGQIDEEWVQIREEARRLFEQAGIPLAFHPGVRSETEVDKQLEDLGVLRDGEVAMGPGPAITLRQFLRRVVEGELSYIWDVPEQVRAECLPRLQCWCEARFDLERLMPMPREVRWTIYRKRGAG